MSDFDTDSVIGFGTKHRGRSIKDILAEDPSYLMWMRESTDHGFTMELHQAVDAVLLSDDGKRLRRNHQTSKHLQDAGKLKVSRTTHSPEFQHTIPEAPRTPAQAYAADWGAF